MTKPLLAWLVVGLAGCAGARTSIRADRALYPISLTHEIRAADGHLLSDREREVVGQFTTDESAVSILYTAVPLRPTSDLSDEVNRQVEAVNGEAVTDLTFQTKLCATDWFLVFHLLPFWPGCSTTRVTGNIVRSHPASAQVPAQASAQR